MLYGRHNSFQVCLGKVLLPVNLGTYMSTTVRRPELIETRRRGFVKYANYNL